MEQLIGASPAGAVNLIRGYSQYRNAGEGILTTNFAEAGGFLRTRPGLSRPDVQLHFVIAIVDDHARKLHLSHGYSCHVSVLRPSSRWTVGVSSADPAAAPRIDPQFLSRDDDIDTLLRGLKLTLDIMERPALAPFRGRCLFGEHGKSDEALRQLIRARADTIYHAAGTCRMGTDAMAVVDPQLRVHGIQGLRIADASIMPTIIGGNTNAATIMIGEKAVDLLRCA